MMDKQVVSLINLIPEKMQTIALTVVCILIYWLWKNLLYPYIKIKKNELIEKEKEKERVIDKHNVALIELINDKLIYLYNKCYNRGYRNLYFNKLFYKLKDKYEDLGGNTDIKSITSAWEYLPLKTELGVPCYEGHKLASKEMQKTMVDFYKNVSNKIIPEDRIHTIEPVVEMRTDEDNIGSSRKAQGHIH